MALPVERRVKVNTWKHTAMERVKPSDPSEPQRVSWGVFVALIMGGIEQDLQTPNPHRVRADPISSCRTRTCIDGPAGLNGRNTRGDHQRPPS